MSEEQTPRVRYLNRAFRFTVPGTSVLVEGTLYDNPPHPGVNAEGRFSLDEGANWVEYPSLNALITGAALQGPSADAMIGRLRELTSKP